MLPLLVLLLALGPSRSAEAQAVKAKHGKHLVYTTVGGDKSYYHCLKWLILSLEHSARHPNFDFLIIASEADHADIQMVMPARHIRFPVRFLLLDPAEVDRPGEQQAVAASSRKLDLWRWKYIQQYTNVLFLDADYLVNMDVSRLLDQDLKGDTLYSHHEQHFMITTPPNKRAGLHNKPWWGFGNYTKDDISRFNDHGVLPFSAGCFMFKVTPNMLETFRTLKATMITHKGKYFFEQSFMNYYFNMMEQTNSKLLTPYILEYWTIASAAGTYYFSNKLVHFVYAGAVGIGEKKDQLMAQFYHTEILGRRHEKMATMYSWLGTLSAFALESVAANKRAKWWSNAGHIGQVPRQVERYFLLAAKPSVATICEVGFNAGHTAAVFLAANPHAELYSFDQMKQPYSDRSMALFKSLHTNFHFVKGPSSDTVAWLRAARPDLQCDLFSVDGDHSHDSALTDFLNAISMMPEGATLLANDVSDRFPGFKYAFETLEETGHLTHVQCEGPSKWDAGNNGMQSAMPNDGQTAAAAGGKRWCWATVAKPKQQLFVPILPTSQTYDIDVTH